MQKKTAPPIESLGLGRRGLEGLQDLKFRTLSYKPFLQTALRVEFAVAFAALS